MSIRQLQPDEWVRYFGTFSSRLAARRRIDYAEIRILSLEDGDQIGTHWLPLHGITYEPGADMLEVDVDGLGHRVYSPDAIYVDEDTYGLLRIDVVKADGGHELIEIR